MLSVSLEKNSGLFGTDVYDETKENKPKYEHEEGLEFGSDFDFDGEFEKYAAMGAAEKQSGAWMTNFKNLEFPLEYPRRCWSRRWVYLLHSVVFFLVSTSR